MLLFVGKAVKRILALIIYIKVCKLEPYIDNIIFSWYQCVAQIPDFRIFLKSTSLALATKD